MDAYAQASTMPYYGLSLEDLTGRASSMEAKALNPRALFDLKVCYEIPAFQRPYVWNEEDQWQPLWDDIQRVAEAVLVAGPVSDGDTAAKAPRHFLGAVVLKQLSSAAGDPLRNSVIDGQQRLTTLQLVLGAARLVMEERGQDEVAESLAELIANTATRFRGTPKQFKLWPSRVDRAAFEAAMASGAGTEAALGEVRIVAAFAFFRRSIGAWADRTDGTGTVAQRLTALRDALEKHLQIVAIDLGAGDDDQLIFETLNDRGTPLLAADLIKNYVFQRGEELGADTESWSEQYWKEFDEDWWRCEVAQGRLFRSRIDMFLQYWLTMRLQTEIPTDSVFVRFRSYSLEHLVDRVQAAQFLAGLRRDADLFRDLVERDEKTPGRRFYARVVEALEFGVFIPLLLWLINDRQTAPQPQVERALEAVESWAVRRILLRRTMKDVNNLVVALLRELAQNRDQIGDATVAFLKAQQADARQWPTDEELVNELPMIKAYGNIKQARLGLVLAGIELHLRTVRHEDVSLPARLEIEHVMPQGWRRYWDGEGREDPVAEARRDGLVNSLGNLTLVTKKLNGALSDRPWTDAEAVRIAPTGKDAGLGKRTLLDRYSVLVLNRELISAHVDAWREEDIVTRSRQLAAAVAAAWPRN